MKQPEYLYTIVTGTDHDIVAVQVSNWIKEGFLPFGNVSVTATETPGRFVYTQSLVHESVDQNDVNIAVGSTIFEGMN